MLIRLKYDGICFGILLGTIRTLGIVAWLALMLYAFESLG